MKILEYFYKVKKHIFLKRKCAKKLAKKMLLLLHIEWWKNMSFSSDLSIQLIFLFHEEICGINFMHNYVLEKFCQKKNV